MKLYFVLFALPSLVAAQPGPNLLFPHMANNGDTEFPYTCDDCSFCVNTTGSYGVFKKYYNNICVGTNGYVTFGGGEWQYVPRTSAFNSTSSMIAPYWSDIYIPSNLHTSHLWYRETTDQTLRNRADSIIQARFSSCGGINFLSTHLFIVTWQRLGSYCEALSYTSGCNRFPNATDTVDNCNNGVPPGKRDVTEFELRDEYRREEKPHGPPTGKSHDNFSRNSFQVVLATDGVKTFAFNHIHTIEFECCFADTQMVINAGDGIRFWKHHEPAHDCLENNSNAGTNGRWAYRVDELHVRNTACAVIT